MSARELIEQVAQGDSPRVVVEAKKWVPNDEEKAKLTVIKTELVATKASIEGQSTTAGMQSPFNKFIDKIKKKLALAITEVENKLSK